MAGPGAVDADQDPGRNRAGTCAIAAASTSMWSVTVFDPALPGRSSIARHSAVFASQAPSGWKP
jgi:stress-induced morphogen